MKRLSMIILWLLAVLAVGALTAVSASAALPELLGAKAFPQKWTGSGGEGTSETLKGESIKCASATGDGEQLTHTLGDYHIHYKGCSALNGAVKCNSTGDETGVILDLGEYHFVSDPKAPNVAILFLLGLSFECTALAKFTIEGHVLCLFLKPLELNATHELHCKTVSAGMPEDKKWTNDSGVEETAVLLASKNGGAFEEAAEIRLGTIVFPEPVAFHEPF